MTKGWADVGMIFPSWPAMTLRASGQSRPAHAVHVPMSFGGGIAQNYQKGSFESIIYPQKAF
jgi:hypothetical protein